MGGPCSPGLFLYETLTKCIAELSSTMNPDDKIQKNEFDKLFKKISQRVNEQHS